MENFGKKKKIRKAPRRKKVAKYALFMMAAQLIALVCAKSFGRKKQRLELKKTITQETRQMRRSLQLIKDFFIPHEGNDHKPHSVRTKALGLFVVAAVVIKAAATLSLYLIYPSPAEMSAVVASKMLELTNSARQESGSETLRLDPVLTRAAFAKANDMLERGYFAHDTPEGRRPWEWIEKGKYDYVYAGENLAMGFNSAELVQAAFMDSPTHKKNIVNKQYMDIGLAVLSGVMDGRQTDILVEIFGTRREDIRLVRETTTKQVGESPSILAPEPDQRAEAVLETESAARAGLKGVSDQDVTVQTSEPVLFVVGQKSQQKSLVDLIIEYTNIVFIAFIIFIAISLLLNILIKVRFQHPRLIMQSIVVLALLTSLIVTKFHFIEMIAPQLLIL